MKKGKGKEQKKAMVVTSSFVEIGSLGAQATAVNWTKQDVLTVSGIRRDNAASKYQEVRACSKSRNGDVVDEFWIPAHYPVLTGDDALVTSIMAEHNRLFRVVNGRGVGLKVQKMEEVEVTDPDTGKTTTEMRPKQARVRVPRVGMDPTTGCTPGTSGHAVGLIVLRQKVKGFDRAKAIATAMKELKMDKGLASSWVSTLIKRKAPFAVYGGNA